MRICIKNGNPSLDDVDCRNCTQIEKTQLTHVDKKCFNDGIKMKFVVEFKNLNAVLD